MYVVARGRTELISLLELSFGVCVKNDSRSLKQRKCLSLVSLEESPHGFVADAVVHDTTRDKHIVPNSERV